MHAIQRQTRGGEWGYISQAYCGMTKAEARCEIATLRRWATDDESDVIYRIIIVSLVPR